MATEYNQNKDKDKLITGEFNEMVSLKDVLGKWRGTPKPIRQHKLTKIWVTICWVMRRWREITITMKRKKIHTTTIKFLILSRCLQFIRCLAVIICLTMSIKGPR